MSRFDRLLDGYLHNSLTQSELEELFDLIDKDPDLQLVRDQHFHESHAGLTTEEQRQKMLANIREKVQPKRMWRWTAAAAAVLILVISSTILLRHHKESPLAITPIKYKNDVAPGRTGATLRLADGSTLTLDSLANGVIARQGSAQVLRQANGTIAYLSPKQNPTPNTSQNQTSTPTIHYNKLSTGKGRQFQVVLPDGTKAWLNSSSSLTYPTTFTTTERRVTMTGEAYFEVAPNASQPFVVTTGEQNITVLGTHFNVNAYEDEPIKKTTLLQGAIRVNSTLLSPGEEAATDHNTTHKKAVNAEDAVAWKNGYFQFDNASLPAVMRQLARWYDVEVRYEGPIPQWDDFKGQIGRDLTLAQVLKILEQTRVHFRIEEDKRIVIFP